MSVGCHTAIDGLIVFEETIAAWLVPVAHREDLVGDGG